MPKTAKSLYNKDVMNMHRMARSFFKKTMRRLAVSRRGAAAVEFALITPFLLAGLTGVANYGIAMYDKMELVSAARTGAQLAIYNGTNTTTTETAAIAAAVVAASNLSITTNDVTALESYNCDDGTSITDPSSDTCADGGSIQYYMTVTATETFIPMIIGKDAALLIFGRDSLTLSGSVRVRTK